MTDAEAQYLLLVTRMVRALWMARMRGEDDIALGKQLDDAIEKFRREHGVDDRLRYP